MSQVKKRPFVDAGLLSGWLLRKRIEAAKPFISGRVLDFACGHGHLASVCDPEDYYGYDTDSRRIAWARENFPRHRFETVLPESAQYDTVAALAFIEHVEAEPYLQQLGSLVADGGRLVLTTPHPAFEWGHTLGARVHLFSAEANDEHEALIPAAEMRRLAGQNQLELTVSRRFLYGANQLFVLTKAS